MSQDKLLIVVDEKAALKNLEQIMKKEGYETVCTTSGANALRLVEEQEVGVVLFDYPVGNVDDLEILERCKGLYSNTEVIMLTSNATIPSAVEAIKKGAYDYIAKPFEPEEVKTIVASAFSKVRLCRENIQLCEQIKKVDGEVKIITQDTEVRRLLQTARQIAPTDCNVIITGESGTGKELFARYVHFSSQRTKGPFFAINCGAFNEELLTNELFGHEKGAFTGALTMKRGLIEVASGGTLFLDEVTEMSPSMQVKLLRVLQEKEMIRLGAIAPVKVDVRIIAATNRDIREEMNTGRFRNDLYFRLNVVTLRLPPLSDRKGDIPLLSRYFLDKYSTLMQKDVTEISQDVLHTLMNYDLPGNVRELENIIERGVALSNAKTIETAHLPEDLKGLSIRTFRPKEGRMFTLAEQEEAYIKLILKKAGGNKTVAAEILGIDRVTLWRKLKAAVEENP